jgi:hypothetical protein
MEIADIVPPSGKPRRLRCDNCGSSTILTFETFSHVVSGVQIDIANLPMLACPECGRTYLPDRSAAAIVQLHEDTRKRGMDRVTVHRKSRSGDFGFTGVPFLVDSDDYYYIPGLYRPFNEGFLAPLFFNRSVLIKFDASPDYSVRFASPTYGTIEAGDDLISFGINRHGRVIMWLGDIAKLPESEQFYLRSENVPSDHSVGSDFFDGQIECVFTDLTNETLAVKARSAFATAFEAKFGKPLYHLDEELIETIAAFAPPIVDTEKERKHAFDGLNRMFVESIDNAELEKLLGTLGVKADGSGSLKRLQATLETVDGSGSVSHALMPFYVIYDLRIAYSHLTSFERRAKLLKSAEDRLTLPNGATLDALYAALVKTAVRSLATLTAILA